jgi:fumarate hydratase subunit alpha
MLSYQEICAGVGQCLVKAGTTFRDDQLEAYAGAIKKESNPNAQWALEKLLENALAAQQDQNPLCDDTGIPHVIVEIGNEVALPVNWLSAVHDGVAQGLRDLPGRPMAVLGDDIERVEQSRGLSSDPSDILPVPVICKPVPGQTLTVTVLLQGGGPEIRAKTYRVFHKRSIDKVLEESATWMADEIQSLGCTPAIIAIGVGRSHAEASIRMLEAMATGDLRQQSQWEVRVTDRVNAERAGALGLGGDVSVLGTFIKIGPLRASGIRVVCARPCCCVEPRRAQVAFAAGQVRVLS